MKSDSFKKNRKALTALLLCTGFIAAHPLAMRAEGSGSSVQTVQQQQIKVTGTVNDDMGPIIGASVVEKGSSSNGTITDMDGNFALSVKPGAVLLISYIGYKPQEVQAVAGKAIKITLKEDTEMLDEVVIVGFGTQKKVNLTGAVGTLSSKELKERPVTSAVAALQGLVPGLNITTPGGSLETKPAINVRGATTIGEGSTGDPLVLIDGMEGDLYSINPQDIENISVLKDAAASSIYGSRAAFGVILVTTKSGGTDGTTQISYNNSFRFSNPINKKHMLNSEQFAIFVNDALSANGNGVRFGEEYMQRILDWRYATPVSNGVRRKADGTLVYAIEANAAGQWNGGFSTGADDVEAYDVLYKDWNFSQEHNVSASGGTKKFNYYASGSFYGNDGQIKLGDEGLNRYTVTGKINSDIQPWLRFSLNMRFTREDYHRPSRLGWNTYEGLGAHAWPTLPLYDRNGNYVYNSGNALALTDNKVGGTDKTQTDNIYLQSAIELEPIKNWVTKVDMSYRTKTANRRWDTRAMEMYDINGQPYLIHDKKSRVHEELGKNNYYNFSATSRYSFSLNENHNFNVLAGMQAENEEYTFFSAERLGILDENNPTLGLTTGLDENGNPVSPDLGSNNWAWSVFGVFGRLNYDYKSRYLIEANVRTDGSSRFLKSNRWRTFPSVSVGWNIAQESFFKDYTKWCNMLKLRASYGSLGNQNTKPEYIYQVYSTIAPSPNSGSWLQDGKKPGQAWAPGLVSSALTWEKVESWNFGFDWGFLNNRLTGSFDYFIRTTTDMMGKGVALPNILGTGVPMTNNTDLRSKGWEMSIEWRDRLANGLSYSARFNVSDAKAKILEYPNNPTGYIYDSYPGKSVGEIWGYESIGIARSEEEMRAHLESLDRRYEEVNGVAPAEALQGQNHMGQDWKAGDMMYKDINGDGRISKGSETLDDLGDKKVIGNTTPRYRFGLDLNAAWKGFDLRVFFQGVMKRDYYQGGPYMFGWQGDLWSNFAGIQGVEDYYRDENSWSVQNGYAEANINSSLPRLSTKGNSGKNTTAQTAFLQDASYIRLKNLQIGYTIPANVTRKFGVSRLRVYVSGENLWTGTSLRKQFDPETIGEWNGNGYPLSTTLSGGLSLTF